MTVILYVFSHINRAEGWFKQLTDGILDPPSCTIDHRGLKLVLPDGTYIFARAIRNTSDLIPLTGMRFGVIIEEQQFKSFDGWYTWRQMQNAKAHPAPASWPVPTTRDESTALYHQHSLALIEAHETNKRQAVERLVRRLKRVAALKAARAKPRWDLKW